MNQLKQIGLSCDFDNVVYTLDDNYYQKVIEAFVKMYNAGLIYKGKYITNWCSSLMTAISDEECTSSEETVGLYYIRYKLESSSSENEYLEIATTRPETIFGDLAVAYNPNDERYKKYKGMNVIVPIINKSVPLIEDDAILIEFGTGLCKITPGHDETDFQIGKRHNLPVRTIIDKRGHICNTGTEYDGMFKNKARKLVLEKLKETNCLINETTKKSKITRCSRTNCIIEPLVTDQWFIKMEHLANLASDLLVTKKVKFIPSNVQNSFNSWVSEIRDWCISRQIVYGHQFPIWYCSNGHVSCSAIKPDVCHCDNCECNNLTQETDCLDTWASSWIWQYAIFSAQEVDYYYPLDVVITGKDILFFWIMRMMMSSAYFHNKEPFKCVLFHGIIRDANGQKQSKSKGNGVDPLDMINKIGLDPSRFGIMMCMPKEGDLKFKSNSLDIGKVFCTKLWNVARYLLMNDIFKIYDDDYPLESPEDTDIVNKLNELDDGIFECFQIYDLQKATSLLYLFTWNAFANGYVEYAKLDLTENRKNILKHIFQKLLWLLHPIIPFITQEISEIINFDIMNQYYHKQTTAVIDDVINK